MLRQVLSLGGRSPSWRFPSLGHGGHQRLRVRVLKKTHFSWKGFLLGDISSIISGGASLCIILHRRRRRTFCGSFLDPSGQSRTSRWDIHLYHYPNRFERTFTWFWFNFELRWSETCRRTSARALASSPWPTTRRLLSPFRWGIFFAFFCQFLQFYHNFICTEYFFLISNTSQFQSLNGYTLGNRVLQVSFKTNNRKV